MREAEAKLIHDVRNAVAVIRMASAQLGADDGRLTPETRRHLTDMIARRSDMLEHLLADLTLVSEVGDGDLRVRIQRVALTDLCHDVLGERALPAGVELTCRIAPDAVVLSDPLRVTQVMDNLLTNALRYGGPRITVDAVRVGSEVRIDVHDDGDGVPPDLLDSLFEAYVSGPDSSRLGGRGLGLRIVRSLCEALGGSVTYDGSTGALFTVTLPAAPEARIGAQQGPQRDTAPMARTSG